MPQPTTRLVPIVDVKLVRTGSIRYADRDISSPAAAVSLVREIIADQIENADREYFVAVYLNTKNRPVGYHTVSIGTLNAALVHPREVFTAAVHLKAHAVVVAHNHPSGDPKPSREDLQVTKRLQEAGQILGVELLDSLVIGHTSYVSLRERGHLA